MKLLLLGATGRTGKLVLKEALAKGYQVNCLSRKSERIQKHEGLTIFEGEPNLKDDLIRAIDGCDAVISVLNVSRKSDFPWSALRTQKTFLSDTMNGLIPVAQDHGVKRLIVCSAWGVAETKEDLPGWFRWFIDHSNIGVAYADHERQERLVEGSGLDWSIVRPVGLTNTLKTQKVLESYDNVPKPRLTISRLSVAKYMVNAIASKQLIGKKIVISSQ